MYRFLREPRWIALFALVPVGVIICLLLSDWQWNRHLGRDDANVVLESSLSQPVAPVGVVMPVGSEIGGEQNWRLVSATGVYLPAAQVLVRQRPLGGVNGMWVITPLVTDDGTALLVNRGWLKAGPDARTSPQVPAAPTGPVTITGRVQGSQSGPAQEAPDIPVGQVSAVDVAVLSQQLSMPAYPGYVDLVASDPPQQPGLTAIAAPEVSSGPHLSYSLQWIVFAIIFLGGLVLLIRREAKMRKEETSALMGDSDDRTQDSEPSQTAR